VVDPATAGLKEGKKTPREGFLTQPRIQNRLATPSLKKSCRLVKEKCQASPDRRRLTFRDSPPTTARTGNSSSTNAVNISSARTTKRFPSPRCASTIQIVRPLESKADLAAPTPTGFAEIVSDHLPITLHAAAFCLFCARHSNRRNEIGHAKFYSRSHDAVIRVYDAAGNVIETHEHPGDFEEW
jgi:hypothetical protein